MKLSFSTKGWHNHTFDEFCDMAASLGYAGVEIHNIHGAMFTDRDGAFYDYAAAATLRRLYEKKLTVPCIDCLIDPSDANRAAEAEAEILHCMDVAGNLHIPYIRLRTAAEKNIPDPQTGGEQQHNNRHQKFWCFSLFSFYHISITCVCGGTTYRSRCPVLRAE